MLVRAVLALCLVAAAAPGSAATITGQITERASGAAIVGLEVRLYTLSAKGWVITTTTTSNGSGNYSFSGLAGDYLVQAVPPNLFGTCYARRYYDVAAPTTGGTLESTADVITVAGATVVTGINLALDVVGAIDGRVTQGGVGLNGTLVRVERIADTRIHVITSTFISGGTPGTFAVRGLDPGTHRIWIHHPTALYEDLIAPGPYTVTSGTRLNVGSFAVVAIGNDPYEPNPAPASGTPLPAVANAWESSGAILTPGSDVDFFCLDAFAGDRYVITSTTTSTVAGQERPSPWVDPMLGWFSASPVQLLLANDDDPTAPGSLNARIDTGVVPANARYCVGVTSYNDPDFNGSGQFSAGRYAVRIASDAMFANGFEGLP